jgi:hypothetical protein
MTGKQIRLAMDAIPHGIKSYHSETKQQKREYAELSCREMINSIMIYGNINSPYNEKEDKLNNYLEERWQERGMFYVPRKRIIELVKEQQADFAKAVVKSGVYTDYEGCTYNTCVWADEM